MTDARTMEDPLVYTRTVVGHAAYHAGQQGRTDLVERLERHRSLLDQLEGATVAVVGLCDAGKSSLINACVGQVVVPVDLVHPTPVSATRGPAPRRWASPIWRRRSRHPPASWPSSVWSRWAARSGRARARSC